MKKLAQPIEVVEIENEGLASFLGKKIMLFCMNYHYAGTLEGVNDSFVKLSGDDARIVYESGEWSKKDYSDAQKPGGPIYVQRSAIEAFIGGK